MKDHGVPFGEAMRVWARVAALSFGGPAGQIAVMHRIIVEEKKWIGEIVHDIDLKDDKYGRAETAGVKSLIAGIATPGADDQQRLARGAVLLDGLYDSFALKKDNK